MFVRKKDRKTLLQASSAPPTDPAVTPTPLEPPSYKHTAAMQTAIQLWYTISIYFTYMARNLCALRKLLVDRGVWLLIHTTGTCRPSSAKVLNKVQSQNRKSEIMLSTALGRCGTNSFGKHRVRTAGKRYGEIYSQFLSPLQAGVSNGSSFLTK
jgi:hypothetical protein